MPPPFAGNKNTLHEIRICEICYEEWNLIGAFFLNSVIKLDMPSWQIIKDERLAVIPSVGLRPERFNT